MLPAVKHLGKILLKASVVDELAVLNKAPVTVDEPKGRSDRAPLTESINNDSEPMDTIPGERGSGTYCGTPDVTLELKNRALPAFSGAIGAGHGG